MSLAAIGRVFLAVFFVLAASLAPGLGAAMPVAASSHGGSQSAATVSGSDIADAYVSSRAQAANFGAASFLLGKRAPAEAAHLAFDTSAYEGHNVVQATDLVTFSGRGSEHGVGMSQYGAYGRALAGQTYTQILGAYYTGTTIGHIRASTRVRVQLAASHVPAAASPARITARSGGWKSSAFVNALGIQTVFPSNSYVDMVHGASGWEADVYDSAGVLVARKVTSDLTIKPATRATLMEIKWRDGGGRFPLVRGSMRLLVNGSGVEAINILSMDDYLRAVVPAEMPASWAPEALKAQAVAARSYAYVRLKPGKAFDVRPTTDNQVYSGYSHEKKASNRAVASTSRQVVMHAGKVADAFFFAIGGGATENNEDVWGVSSAGKITSRPIPYLRGISDVAPNGVAYDSMARNYAWSSASFTLAQLGTILGDDARTAVGTLLSVKFDRGFSGRIYRATIVGSARTVYVSGSIFKSVYNANRLSGRELRSTMFWLRAA